MITLKEATLRLHAAGLKMELSANPFVPGRKVQAMPTDLTITVHNGVVEGEWRFVHIESDYTVCEAEVDDAIKAIPKRAA
jgi:hypothetical protein